MSSPHDSLRRVQAAVAMQGGLFDGACLAQLQHVCDQAQVADPAGAGNGEFSTQFRRLVQGMLANAAQRQSRTLTLVDYEAARRGFGDGGPFPQA